MTVKIRAIKSKADYKKFVMLPWYIYKDDPNWVPPLIMEQMETLDTKKNPFFEHGEAQLFLAEKDGVTVGRITAHINRLHNEYYNEKTGFFGFFESINDSAVSESLLQAAEDWLKAHGSDNMIGPACFSVNEGYMGILAEHREGPPMIMCSYNPPYYTDLLENAGYEKAKDLFGWHYEIGQIPDAPLQLAEAVEQQSGLTVRQVDPKHMERDVRIVQDIYNASWSRNWGYVPWTELEIKHSAKMMKLILIPELTAIAEIEGQPAGMMLAFPNILEVTKDLNGRLFPTGIIKLLYQLKVRKSFKTARLFLLGVKPEFRGSIMGGLSVLLYVWAHRAGQKLGLEAGELGWTLEDNQKINAGIQFMGGRIGKIYRMYGKSL